MNTTFEAREMTQLIPDCNITTDNLQNCIEYVKKNRKKYVEFIRQRIRN